MPCSPLFVLVAGEASGDLLGAGLIQALRERFPSAQFVGIGGPRMIAAGFDAWHSIERLSVMGYVEVLRHLPGLLAIRRDTARRALGLKPAAFIGIDAPDFNLGLERRLKRAGIATVHYVSPSVWAWKEQRAARIGRSADLVLCLFPMEPPIYARHGVDARFVGHPLADTFALDPDRGAARAELGLTADVPVLAILPGSRLGEISRLGEDFLGAVRLLRQRIPNLHVLAPMANAACRTAFEQLPEYSEDIEILDGRAHTAMIASDAVLLASGTATLEAMLAKRPMVVAYRLAAITYRLIKGLGLLKVKRYALPNVLACHDLVPELMQENCTPQALADALYPAFCGDTDSALAGEFRRLHLELRHDASTRAAAAIAGLVTPATVPCQPVRNG